MDELQKKLLEVCDEWVETHKGHLRMHYHVGFGENGREFRRRMEISYGSIGEDYYKMSLWDGEKQIRLQRVSENKNMKFEQFLTEKLGNERIFIVN